MQNGIQNGINDGNAIEQRLRDCRDVMRYFLRRTAHADQNVTERRANLLRAAMNRLVEVDGEQNNFLLFLDELRIRAEERSEYARRQLAGYSAYLGPPGMFDEFLETANIDEDNMMRLIPLVDFITDIFRVALTQFHATGAAIFTAFINLRPNDAGADLVGNNNGGVIRIRILNYIIDYRSIIE